MARASQTGDRSFREFGRRRGFTLLEILLALGLSAILLMAVAAAIDLYRRMTIAGQDQVGEARLVRAVLHKIETDLRSIMPPQSQVTSPYDSGSASSGSSTSGGGGGGSAATSTASTGSTSTSQATAMMDPLQNVYAQTVFGLYGDQRTIVFNSLCAHRPTAMSSDPNVAQPLNAIHGDLKTVAYFVSAAGQTTSGTPASGLARLEGDHVAVGYAMQQSASSLAAAARVIAPEVVAITFRYFDGAQWLTTWDAAFLQALPTAVEVTITVRAADPTGSGPTTSQAAQTETRQYRHVVAISTMAQPMSIAELVTIPTGTTP